MQWSAPAWDGGSAVTGYDVYRGTSSGGESLLAQVGNVTSYTDSTATNGTTYFYKVSAVNSVGEGAQSGELSALPGRDEVWSRRISSSARWRRASVLRMSDRRGQ